MTEDQNVWELDLIDEALEIPGWIIIPRLSDPYEQDEWARGVSNALTGVLTWEGDPVGEDVKTELIAASLSERARSDSMAVMQIWPPMARRTAMCHIDVVPSAALPDWSNTDATVHRVEEPHLGAGLQVSTRRTEVFEDVEIDLSSLTFVFDNNQVTFLISLPETLTPLVSLCAAGLVSLMRNLRLIRSSDGELFQATDPHAIAADEEWAFEVTP